MFDKVAGPPEFVKPIKKRSETEPVQFRIALFSTLNRRLLYDTKYRRQTDPDGGSDEK